VSLFVPIGLLSPARVPRYAIGGASGCVACSVNGIAAVVGISWKVRLRRQRHKRNAKISKAAIPPTAAAMVPVVALWDAGERDEDDGGMPVKLEVPATVLVKVIERGVLDPEVVAYAPAPTPVPVPVLLQAPVPVQGPVPVPVLALVPGLMPVLTGGIWLF
jgi:hypothetical protein